MIVLIYNSPMPELYSIVLYLILNNLYYYCTYSCNVILVFLFSNKTHPQELPLRRNSCMHTSIIASVTSTRSSMTPHRHAFTVSKQQRCHALAARLDLDSHADTTVLGSSFKVLEDTLTTCTVAPFLTSYAPTKDIPIVTGGTAYTDPETGTTYILVVNQGLYFGEDLQHSLLNPNQCRCNEVIVDDVPVHLSQGESSTHTIYIGKEKIRLPLLMDGVISYLPTRYPTDFEVSNCLHLELTSRSEWMPHSDSFQANESAITQDRIFVAPDRQIYAMQSTCIAGKECMSNIFSENVNIYHSNISSAASSLRNGTVSKEALSRIFHIGLETAKRTLAATTQLAIKNVIRPISRRYRTKQAQFRYNLLNCTIYSDTMFSSTKSISGNNCGQLFANNKGFCKFIPMEKESEAGDSLAEFIQDVGIPKGMHTDGAKAETLGRWKQITTDYNIRCTRTEPHSPWQNRAERTIKELKKMVRLLMHTQRVPLRLWDFAAVYASEVMCRTAQPLYSLHGRTPIEIVTGETPDISEYVQFTFYQAIYYWDQTAAFPEEKRKLGRWLGVSHRVGQALCYWILPKSGIALARTTVEPVKTDELATSIFQEDLKELDASIHFNIGDTDITSDVPRHTSPKSYWDTYDDEAIAQQPFDSAAAMPQADDFTPDSFDDYIAAEVVIQKADGFFNATVIDRKRDSDGNPIGVRNANPILDTRVYNLQFPDGHVEAFAANVIAQSLWAQTDDDGNEFLLLQEITGWKKDSTRAISSEDSTAWCTSHNGNRHRTQTTAGWLLEVAWKGGTTTWVPLQDLKESNPLQVAEYAVAQDLLEEPAFAWWAASALKSRDKMISAVKSRFHKKTHKYGICVPRSIKEALDLDLSTGTTFWRQALDKEMKNVDCAFKFLDLDAPAPKFHKFIILHMIFDVKMDFSRKCRLVAGGHMTNPPTSMTYSSVVSRDSVRIAFLVAALNDLDILAADVSNAYIQSDTKEKVYTRAGPEFGSRQGQLLIIVRSLYGLKSSGACWHEHLAERLSDLGYRSCLADPDVWMRPAVKPCGFTYWEYILVYVDDILVISNDPRLTMNVLEKLYRMKEGSVGVPTTYLGSKISKHYFNGDSKGRWSMSSEQYVKEAIRVVELELQQVNKRLSPKAKTPYVTGYRPEMDTSPLLGDVQANYYQNLIGILRWSVELGRIDIYYEVATLSSFLVQPRHGHLEQVFHIFAYLKSHDRSKMVFDDSTILLDESRFVKQDWTTFYRDAAEKIPPNAPTPRGRGVDMHAFVDADHAGNRVTRRSHTGILVFLNNAPILWFSKKQNTVETSSFGSEFVAMKTAVELIESLRYKLRMFGIPLEGPTNVFCDNQACVTNSTVPVSTLSKKHNSIAYHRVREAVAAGTIRIAKEPTETNLADMLTKSLPGPRLKNLCKEILY